ncbi:2-keto-4-pentenoate hydratase [Asaia bogorensis]|uniref:2-keto-4-pentenoate hydratase n=1 Tax=Asaia bogorensis TaxID=91915 RepID=UPI001F08F72F|nr:2-keto-4-pentenoate hydratase [Asaia bogorensis]
MITLDLAPPGEISSVCDTASAAVRLLNGRHTRAPLQALDDSEVPRTEDDAYRIQDAVAAALIADQGNIMGWKVGAPSPTGLPFAAPLHEATLFDGDTTLAPGLCRHRGVEAEIVYRLGRDLPWRDRPWSLGEVMDAIDSVHTAIEIIDTRFVRPGSQPRLVHLADQASHGALVIGQGAKAWQRLSPVCETVRLAFSDGRVIEHIGGNSAGDPRRLLVWLANHAMGRGIPLMAGCMITTGSMTDTIFVPPGTMATARIAHLQPITVEMR